MADMKQIHDFAVKWCGKFRDPNAGYKDLIDRRLADECDNLGFLPDCGHSFSQKYGRDAMKYNKLYDIINNITDIQLLGSAIYSQWRFFAHWAHSAEEIASFESRAWFAVAFFRLAALTEDSITAFHGNLKTIRIVSDNTYSRHSVSPNAELIQHIKIDKSGDVYFDGCVFNKFGKKYEKARVHNFTLDNSAVKHLFDIVTSRFADKYCNAFSADVDNWLLELTDDDDAIYRFRGPLNDDFKDLSDRLRDILGIEGLYLFDGSFKTDAINKITLDYTKNERIKIEKKDAPGEWEDADISFSELLIIDRKNGIIEHNINFGTGRKISHKYESADFTQKLFSGFENEILFCGTSNDTDGSEAAKRYKITVDYENKPQYTVSGAFDKSGLPKGFDRFIKAVYEFINLCGASDIFNPDIYGRISQKNPHCLICGVVFEFGYKKYNYLTNDDSIKAGDTVLVPTGSDNAETKATVVEIKSFDASRFPFPTSKLKHIICKCANIK